jgi:hypothetical protein
LEGMLGRARGRGGTCGDDVIMSFGAENQSMQKNERWAEPLAIDGRLLIKGHNNQL